MTTMAEWSDYQEKIAQFFRDLGLVLALRPDYVVPKRHEAG